MSADGLWVASADVARTPVLTPRSELEQRVVSDPRWQEGADWGEPRSGHPEGAVRLHISAVLENVERLGIDERDIQRLRFIAFVHDTFKYRLDRSRPRVGENDHAVLARLFAAELVDDHEVLLVIERHDDAYRAWRAFERDPAEGRRRSQALLDRLGSSTPFFMRFYEADNDVEGKTSEHRLWFAALARENGLL